MGLVVTPYVLIWGIGTVVHVLLTGDSTFTDISGLRGTAGGPNLTK